MAGTREQWRGCTACTEGQPAHGDEQSEASDIRKGRGAEIEDALLACCQ